MSSMSGSSSVRVVPAAGQLLDFAAALADVVRSWRSERELDPLLAAIVRDSTRIVPGVRRASISVQTSKRFDDITARTDGVIAAVDDVQNELQQGPSIDAAARHDAFRTGALATDSRWPAFGPRAAAMDLHSMLALPLYVIGMRLGALNFASDREAAFDEWTEQLGLLFAAHAAVAVDACRRQHQLAEALAARDVIGQAKGIIIYRNRVPSEVAFAMLVKMSQDTNLKLREVAEYVVEHAERSAHAG
jgi:transcriptional regulator with GAF, ATPase, and Fis domain